MNIVICTKHDLAGNLALNKLVRNLTPHHHVHVVLSDYVLKAERENLLASCLLGHERDMVQDIIFPYLDGEFPAGQPEAACHTFAGISALFGITVEQWGRISTPEAAERMHSLNPDVIISCRYDYIFRNNVITIPRYGIYGLHPGALPRLQGLCSPFRAMQMGHARSGCTLFQLDEGLDSGGIIDIGWTRIRPERSLLWNFVQTYFAGIDVLLRHLPTLERGEPLKATPQDISQRAYYSYPTEEEFRNFMRNGGSLVDVDEYLELLSLYLPDGQNDARMPVLEKLVTPSGC